LEDLKIIPTAAVSGWAGLPEFSNFHGTFGPNFKFDPENSKKAAKNWKRVNVTTDIYTQTQPQQW
jgi:hypothetical protein